MTFDATTIADVLRAELRKQGWQTPPYSPAHKPIFGDQTQTTVYVDTIAHAILVRLRDEGGK